MSTIWVHRTKNTISETFSVQDQRGEKTFVQHCVYNWRARGKAGGMEGSADITEEGEAGIVQEGEVNREGRGEK